MTTVEKQIEKRCEQASKKELVYKMNRILDFYGNYYHGETFYLYRHVTEDSYSGAIDLSYHEGYTQTYLEHKSSKSSMDNKKVFEAFNNSVRLYIPGRDWEKELNKVYNGLDAAKKRYEKRKKNEEAKKKKANDAELSRKWEL